jgi:hypothetical protein
MLYIAGDDEIVLQVIDSQTIEPTVTPSESGPTVAAEDTALNPNADKASLAVEGSPQTNHVPPASHPMTGVPTTTHTEYVTENDEAPGCAV